LNLDIGIEDDDELVGGGRGDADVAAGGETPVGGLAPDLDPRSVLAQALRGAVARGVVDRDYHQPVSGPCVERPPRSLESVTSAQGGV